MHETQPKKNSTRVGPRTREAESGTWARCPPASVKGKDRAAPGSTRGQRDTFLPRHAGDPAAAASLTAAGGQHAGLAAAGLGLQRGGRTVQVTRGHRL